MSEYYLSHLHAFYSDSCVDVKDAVFDGKYPEKEALKSGYKSVSVLENETIATLLDRLAPKIVSSIPGGGKNISAISYSSIFHAGLGVFWQPASYIQKITHSSNALTFSVNQGCNSQLISLELLLNFMAANEHAEFAITLSADHFVHNYFDRWNADYGIVYGDGCAGGLVSKESGDFKILHLESRCCGDLEALHYNSDCRLDLESCYSVKKSKKEFLETHGLSVLSQRSLSEVKGLVKRCFEKSGTTMDDVKWVILPNLGMSILEENYLAVLDIPSSKTLWELGSTLGHVGASDAFISLAYLSKTKSCEKGDKVMVIGAGAGFTWSCMLLEASS